MAEVYSHDGTFADTIARVRSQRQTAKAASLAKPLPFNDGDGAFAASKHTVTAGEDTAGTLDIDTGLKLVDSFRFSVYSAAGEKKNTDRYSYSVSGGVVTLADGGTDQLTATDVIHWEARGK